MKPLLGLLLILVGIFAGLYVGLYWAFILGIADLINAIRATNLDAMRIACDVARILFAGTLGGTVAFLCIAPGTVMLGWRR